MDYRWFGDAAVLAAGLFSSTAQAAVTVVFEDPQDGDVIPQHYEVLVRIADDGTSDFNYADIFIDGALPQDWPGCDAVALCGTVHDFSIGTHELSATAHYGAGVDQTVSASITVEVEAEDDATDDAGCRIGSGSPGAAWWAIGLGVIAVARRRPRT